VSGEQQRRLFGEQGRTDRSHPVPRSRPLARCDGQRHRPRAGRRLTHGTATARGDDPDERGRVGRGRTASTGDIVMQVVMFCRAKSMSG